MGAGQLAVACYRRDPDDGRFLLRTLNVLTLRDGQDAEMNAFLDPSTHRWFALPQEVPGENLAGER